MVSTFSMTAPPPLPDRLVLFLFPLLFLFFFLETPCCPFLILSFLFSLFFESCKRLLINFLNPVPHSQTLKPPFLLFSPPQEYGRALCHLKCSPPLSSRFSLQYQHSLLSPSSLSFAPRYACGLTTPVISAAPPQFSAPRAAMPSPLLSDCGFLSFTYSFPLPLIQFPAVFPRAF